MTSTIPLRRLAVLLTAPCAAPPHQVPAPFGVAWGMLYGLPPGAPRTFRPEARRLGASFVRVNLLWSQLEPAPGELRWDDLDAVLAQVDRRDDVILTLLAASPWATRVPAWVCSRRPRPGAPRTTTASCAPSSPTRADASRTSRPNPSLPIRCSGRAPRVTTSSTCGVFTAP